MTSLAVARTRRLPGGLAHRLQRDDEGLGMYDGPAARGPRSGRGAARRPPRDLAH